jgi:hypothetical protein
MISWTTKTTHMSAQQIRDLRAGIPCAFRVQLLAVHRAWPGCRIPIDRC